MSSWYNFDDLKALVVEDSPHMRDLLKLLLHAMRIRTVLLASDGTEAFEMLRISRPDFILTDLEMQPIDGIQFVKMVRRSQDSPAPYIPIVMLTGYAELRRVEQARDAGVNEFLAKPISAHALNARITEIIERPRPFVKCPSYFGPERRRRADPNYNGPWRRSTDADLHLLDTATENTFTKHA
jgi:CheY-like chemotaxis protein